MTPLQIEMLLHYYTRPSDYPDLHHPAQQDAIAYFIDQGYLTKIQLHEETPLCVLEYNPTEKLYAYCEALCRVPEPRQGWIVDMEVKS